MNLDLSFINFCEALVSSDPEAYRLRQSHLDEYSEYGELQHVFMGDWCRLIVQRYRNSTSYHIPYATAILLEAARNSSDSQLRDLILCSFIPNLIEETDVVERIISDLPQLLAADMRNASA
jgi:hypothetical protein